MTAMGNEHSPLWWKTLASQCCLHCALRLQFVIIYASAIMDSHFSDEHSINALTIHTQQVNSHSILRLRLPL